MKPRMFHTRKFADPVSYRTESLAIFASHSVQLTTPQKVLVDTQVGLLIADGTWGAADVIVFLMMVTEQQSLINWKNPGTYTAIPVNFASSFVTKVGYPAVSASSTYIRTQYTPYSNGVQWVQNNAKALCYVKDNVQDDGRALGGISNGNTLIRPRDTSNQFIGRLNGASHTGASNSAGDGLFSVSTSDGANLLLKRNNSTIGTVAAATTGVTNSELLVYAFNDAASPTITPNYYINNNTIQCYAFGSSAMNDATLKTVRDNLAAGL
jgi:hypothetical protein